jgi:hypothetical protein
MNKNIAIAAAGGLLVGILIGYLIGLSRGMSEATRIPTGGMPFAAPGAMPPPGMPPPGMPGGMPPGAADAERTQRIAMNKAAVAQDPKNVGAWIQLGNDYFDSHQQQASVDAYAKALALRPNDPDVMTDQGIMLRELGQFDRAIANFEKAQALAPGHAQSLFNLGVVWVNDKHDSAKGIAYWKRVIEVAPASREAQECRRLIASASPPRP